MEFSQLDIPESLTTSNNSPIDSFFIPVLQCAVSYDVAIGYFSSAWIRDAAEGIAHLASKGGKSRWVISPELSEEDWQLLQKAETPSRDEIAKLTIKSIEKLTAELKEKTRDTLAWLISDGTLTFKVAIPTAKLRGMFHAKFGVFTDDSSNSIAFSGSYNLTGAAETNWEAIEVFSSTRPGEERRIATKRKEFERIWSALDPNLKVYDPTNEELAPFIRIAERSQRPYRQKGGKYSIPTKFLNPEGKLRNHQEKAVSKWFSQNGRGIFNMATGSGKTVTALSVITRLANYSVEKSAKLVIQVVVPFTHLAEQWRKEAMDFEFSPIMCFGDYPNWRKLLSERINAFANNALDILFIITVNKTFSGSDFQYHVRQLDCAYLFVADEMHNLGSKSLRACLPENANFRLGLSATPIRKYDPEGTQSLLDYFGEEAINYGIADAIEDGTLCPYKYYPIIVPLTPEEEADYFLISSKISKAMAIDSNVESNQNLKALLMKRARLIGSATNKIRSLVNLLKKETKSKHNLIYVGDGEVDDETQLDAVMKALGAELGFKLRKFTSKESKQERAEILEMFKLGVLQALVAIRCLDEGVDIPQTQTAYILASSTNEKEFIQRRGRVLRLAQGKKEAAIYDFIVTPSIEKLQETSNQDTNRNIERNLLKRELTRVAEFTSTARNGPEAYLALRDILLALNLTEVL